MELNLQMFGGRGGSSGGSANPAAGNDFQSDFGFKNVGTREVFTSIGGFALVGTATPKVSDVQEYLDTGRFDNYGTNAYAKAQMLKVIIRDMSGRGFDVSITEDKTKLVLRGDRDFDEVVSIGRRNDKWVAKVSNSSGTRERGGMKGALRHAMDVNLRRGR